MGMSASQVRLLTITKRIHSVENEAERVQNQKMLLGLQSDEAYEEYLAAMEKKDIEYSYLNANTGNFDWAKLTINNLFTQPNNFKVKVRTPGVGSSHVEHKTSTLTFPQPTTNEINLPAVGWGPQTTNSQGEVGYYLMSGTNELAFYKGNTAPTTIDADTVPKITYNGADYSFAETHFNGTDMKIYETEYDLSSAVATPAITGLTFPTQHFFSNGPTMLTFTDGDTTYTVDPALGTIDYDVTVTVQDEWTECSEPAEVKAALETITGQSVPSTVLADPDILRDLVYNAYVIIESYQYIPDIDDYDWKETSVATNVGLREKTDNEELAKAEANYEAALRKIDKKEEQYDKDLAKMDQERKALTTQLDTLKTCIKENIDRTFKIFQG